MREETLPVNSDILNDGAEELRARANRSLQRFAVNRLAVTQSSLTLVWRRQARNSSAGPSRLAGLSGQGDGQARAGNEHAGPPGGVGDERQVRAMAKEIKRLIIEDRRRGLSIGG